MRKTIEGLISECRQRLDELQKRLDDYQQLYGVGPARVSATLAAACLQLTKLTEDERLGLGHQKPYDQPSPAPPKT